MKSVINYKRSSADLLHSHSDHHRLDVVVEKFCQAHRGWLAAIQRDQTIAFQLFQSFFRALDDPLVAGSALASGFRSRLPLSPQTRIPRYSLRDQPLARGARALRVQFVAGFIDHYHAGRALAVVTVDSHAFAGVSHDTGASAHAVITDPVEGRPHVVVVQHYLPGRTRSSCADLIAGLLLGKV